MSQHFLLSPAAKTLSLAKVMRMSDADARTAFRKIRWSDTDGEPVCPECGSLESYDLKSRPVFNCKACYKQFSLTSGTIFANRKLAVRDILAAVAVFINGAKGYSALQLSRDLSVGYKTAFVMLHKVREAIKLAREEGALAGDVAVDGAYFGGHVRPANRREDRKDLRKRINQSGKRQSVIVARENNGRTITHVAKHEADGVAFVAANVKHGSTVHADEASHWDKLAAYFPIKRINHQEAYSMDGACSNAAESFFSRMRRSEIGIHHRIAGEYLADYAAELAWRKTTGARRTARNTPWLWLRYQSRRSRSGCADTGSVDRDKLSRGTIDSPPTGELYKKRSCLETNAAAIAAKNIADVAETLRNRTRMLARGMGLCQGMNNAVGPKRKPSDTIDLLSTLKEQTTFLSIVLCASLLERDSDKRSFQYVYQNLMKHDDISTYLKENNKLSCPDGPIKRFICRYKSIDWGVHGRLSHFRNIGIAHIADQKPSRFITYGELESITDIICDLCRETSLMVSGLAADPSDDKKEQMIDAETFWRKALDLEEKSD